MRLHLTVTTKCHVPEVPVTERHVPKGPVAERPLYELAERSLPNFPDAFSLTAYSQSFLRALSLSFLSAFCPSACSLSFQSIRSLIVLCLLCLSTVPPVSKSPGSESSVSCV